MTRTIVKTMQRAVFATLLVAAVAACSTAPGTQVAALPQGSGWIDSAQVPVGADTANEMISNSGRGN